MCRYFFLSGITAGSKARFLAGIFTFFGIKLRINASESSEMVLVSVY